MPFTMKTALVAYAMCVSYVIHVENSSLMDRNDYTNANKHHNNNAINERTQYDTIDGRLFVHNSDDVHLILRKPSKNNRFFFGRIIIPYIICFFAAKGFWPFFPSILQYQVNEMGKKVFSLSDDRIRQFCHGKFDFHDACYRPMIFRGLFIPLGAAHDFDSFNCTWATALPPSITAVTPAKTQQPPATQAPPAPTTHPPSTTTTPKDVVTIATIAPTKPAQQCNCTTVHAASSGEKIEDFDEVAPPSNVNIEIKNIFALGTKSRSRNYTLNGGNERH